MEESYTEQYNKMTKTPINKLITSLAVPTIISMLITNIYNLADAYFVGKINTSASGAIGIVLVIQSIIQAIGFTFGHGSGSIISRKLGEKDIHSANRYASTGFFSALLISSALEILGLVFLNPLLHLLGSTKTILPYARNYGKYILMAAPFFACSCVCNNIMRYEGHASLAMFGLVTGGILNIIGDPIFMFHFNMGIEGAGLSTALSQTISFLVLFYMFISKKTQSRISIRYLRYKIRDVSEIFLTGLPSLMRQGLNSLSTMMLNHSAAVYGDAAVAAMSIVGRICMFIASVMIGIGQGLQPVAAFNYGAKKYSRLRKAFNFTLTLSEIVLCIFAVIGVCLSKHIIGIFRNDPKVIMIGIPALRLQCISLIFEPLGVCTNMTFQSVGERKKATFVAMLRSGIYYLPLIILLPLFMGIFGIQSSQAIADFLTFLTALPMIIKYFNNLPKDDEIIPKHI